MANLKNNIPYPDGLDLSKDPINGAGEHLHDSFTSVGDGYQQLWQTPDNLPLTGGYTFGGAFVDLSNFDTQKWIDFLWPDLP